MAGPPEATERQRKGLIFDKWPFRLDIPFEYQCWVLIFATAACTMLCCMPCVCGTFRNRFAKKFTVWVYTRLHMFFCVILYTNTILIFFTIGLLPDWTINEYVLHLFDFVDWVLIHTVKFLVSSFILLSLYVVVRFKERIAIAAGIEHVTFFRLGKWNILHQTYLRPVEVIIWKVEEVPSGPMIKPNDLFIECHCGQNEPNRTRVHNNAGSSAMIKESFQVNIDENDTEEIFTLLVKDQELLASQTLSKLQIKTKELLQIEASTGLMGEDFTYTAACFAQLQLQPRGKIWIRISPIHDAEEARPLVSSLC